MPRGAIQKDHGKLVEQKILDLIATRPMSARELSAKVHLTLSGVLIYTKRMMNESPRRMRIAAYECRGQGKPAPLYGPGSAPDALYQAKRKPKQPDRIEARMGQLVEVLEGGSYTAVQVGALMNLTTSRAREYIRRLRVMRWAYISNWVAPEGRGDLAPVYSLGMMADKPKPRQTRAERYQKDRKDPEKYERILAQRRHLHFRMKLRQKPNGIFGALGI